MGRRILSVTPNRCTIANHCICLCWLWNDGEDAELEFSFLVIQHWDIFHLWFLKTSSRQFLCRKQQMEVVLILTKLHLAGFCFFQKTVHGSAWLWCFLQWCFYFLLLQGKKHLHGFTAHNKLRLFYFLIFTR